MEEIVLNNEEKIEFEGLYTNSDFTTLSLKLVNKVKGVDNIEKIKLSLVTLFANSMKKLSQTPTTSKLNYEHFIKIIPLIIEEVEKENGSFPDLGDHF